MHAFCALRKKFPQTCETLSPSEKSLSRRVCLLKHPRKVSAAIDTFSATRKFFVQRLPSVNTGVNCDRELIQAILDSNGVIISGIEKDEKCQNDLPSLRRQRPNTTIAEVSSQN